MKNIDYRKILYKIDSSDNTTRILALLQVIATAAAFFYSNYKSSEQYGSYVKPLPYVFAVSQTGVLVVLLIMVFLANKYKSIKLKLNKNTGVLYDKSTNRRNVSLRDDTINSILDEIASSEKLYSVGQKVGMSFYDDFEKDFLIKHDNYPIETKVKKWLDYDSSSGMGNFNLLTLNLNPNIYMEIEIISPFVGDCRGTCHTSRCHFLRGYLDGFCQRLFSYNVKSSCEHKANPQQCKIKIVTV